MSRCLDCGEELPNGVRFCTLCERVQDAQPTQLIGRSDSLSLLSYAPAPPGVLSGPQSPPYEDKDGEERDKRSRPTPPLVPPLPPEASGTVPTAAGTARLINIGVVTRVPSVFTHIRSGPVAAGSIGTLVVQCALAVFVSTIMIVSGVSIFPTIDEHDGVHDRTISHEASVSITTTERQLPTRPHLLPASETESQSAQVWLTRSPSNIVSTTVQNLPLVTNVVVQGVTPIQPAQLTTSTVQVTVQPTVISTTGTVQVATKPISATLQATTQPINTTVQVATQPISATLQATTQTLTSTVQVTTQPTATSATLQVTTQPLTSTVQATVQPTATTAKVQVTTQPTKATVQVTTQANISSTTSATGTKQVTSATVQKTKQRSTSTTTSANGTKQVSTTSIKETTQSTTSTVQSNTSAVQQIVNSSTSQQL